MSVAAYLLKSEFKVSVGLDRRWGRELWHVTGIMGWTRSKTYENVLTQIPAKVGSIHPDPALSNCICTNVTLADGPWVNMDNSGSMEALVLVTYDSDRRWGAAGFQESGTTSEMEAFWVPSFTTGEHPCRNDYRVMRAKIRRTEFRDGTGITEAQKTVAISYTGALFRLYGETYILANPSITRMPTGQTIIRYVFTASAPLYLDGTTALGRNEEFYQSGLGTIGIKSESQLYGSPIDISNSNAVSVLPYWERRLY